MSRSIKPIVALPILFALVGVGTLQFMPGNRAAAQPLLESYRLVDTWDGTAGQSPPGSFFQPAGLDQTQEALFVVESGNHRVQRFALSGAFERAWGSRGSAEDQLDSPRDVAVDGSRLAVTDYGNQRVVMFDFDGQVLETWRPEGLGRPWGIAAGNGRVYVTVPDRGEVVVLAGGAIVDRWTDLDNPRGLDVAPDGRVHVAEAGASQIRVFAPDGSAVGSLATTAAPYDIDVDVTGDRWVLRSDAVLWYPAGSTSSRLAMYQDALGGVSVSDRNGVFVTQASDQRRRHWVLHYPWRPREGNPDRTIGILGFPPGRMNAPHGIVAAPDGGLWVLDGWPRAQQFDPGGTPMRQIVLPDVPVDLAAKSNGEVIVGESRRLVRVAADGTISSALRLAQGTTPFWLTAMVLDASEERVRFLDGTWQAVREYEVTPVLRPADLTHDVGNGGSWELMWDMAAPADNPTDLAYVVNRSAGTVEVYEGWTHVDTIRPDGRAIRVAVDATGHVYVLTLDGLVWKLRGDGTEVAGWDVSAFSAGDSMVVDIAVGLDGRVYTVDQAAATVRVWEVDPSATPEPPARRGGACGVRGDKRAAPSSVRLGDDVSVRLTVGGRCPQQAPRADIMLVIDQSHSMVANGGITSTIAAARAFIERIDFSRDRVGLVAFNNTAQLLQPLTSDPAAATGALDRIVPIGGTEIAIAFRTATSELFGANARTDVQPVIVLLTDGKDNEVEDVLAASSASKALGTRIFTIGFGDVDPMVMVLSASSPEDYFFTPDAGSLVAIYTDIATRISASVLAKTLSIVDELPADMPFAGALAGPTPMVAGSTLRWEIVDVPLEGITISYRVQPQVLGLRSTNVEARADFVDGLDVPGSIRFPIPQVDVLSERPTPVPTTTPFPTPTRLPQPDTLYLPIAVWQRCQDGAVRADVALTLDTSNSMLEAEPSGGTKLDASIRAARAFLDNLALPDDRATIVTFNTEAKVVAPLTGDSVVLSAALAALSTGPGTRIDRGLTAATGELLKEPEQPDRNRVIVLLTDGRSADVTDEEVLETAETAKNENVLLFAVGLGADTDPELLRRIASRPDWYYPAAAASDLAAIYAQIAYALPCANIDWP